MYMEIFMVYSLIIIIKSIIQNELRSQSVTIVRTSFLWLNTRYKLHLRHTFNYKSAKSFLCDSKNYF